MAVLRQVASCLGAFQGRGLVDLVGEDVSGVGQGDGEVQPSQQLHQRFTFSLFQHSQGVSSLVSDGHAFLDGRNDPDGDFSACDGLFDIGQV